MWPPQKRETSSASADARRVDVAGRMAQGRARWGVDWRAMDRRPHNRSHEDRARRASQERQDHALQSPHRLQRRHLALRRRPRRAARRHRAGARSTRGSAQRAVQPKKTTYATFEVVDLAGIARASGPRSRPRSSATPTRCCTSCAPSDDARRRRRPAQRDVVDLETELILADLEVVERRLERLEASIKKQRKDAEVRGAGAAGAAQARAGGGDAPARGRP